MMIWNLLTETAEAEPTPWTSYLIFGLLIVAIIGLFVWQSISGKKKQKQAQEMVNQLKIGDRVKTIGGICGFVAEINDAENTFVLETGTETNKSYVKFDKGAIYQTAPAQGNAVAAPQPQQAPVAEKKVEEVKVEAPVEETAAPNEETPAPVKKKRAPAKKKAVESEEK
jgi:preprotein translocase YajC subunit